MNGHEGDKHIADRTAIKRIKVCNTADDIHTMNDGSKHGASGVEMRRLGQCDEELTADAMRTDVTSIGVSHHTRGVKREAITHFIRQAFRQRGYGLSARTRRIAALDYVVLYYAVYFSARVLVART